MRQMGMVGIWRDRRARRSAIFAASALFHVLLFLTVFSRQAGSLVSGAAAGGGPEGPVFAISLVRVSATRAAEDPTTAAQLRSLALKARADATEGLPIAIARRSDPLAALAQRLAQAAQPLPSNYHALADRTQPQGSAAAREVQTPDLRATGEIGNAHSDAGDGREASTGALWGAIEPCWRNLGFHGQVPVVIEVQVDDRGGLRGPPKVIRDGTALLNEPRLKSEANALAALAACMPRGEARVAGANYRLEFPATR